jgi:hypothetical protein
MLTAAVLAAGTACGSNDGSNTITPPVTTPATVAVVLSAPTLIVGSTATATATVRDISGATITSIVTWSSSNSGVATVNASSGAMSAVSPGTAQITATAGSKQGSATLTVVAAPSGNATNVNLTAAGQSTSFLESPAFNANLALQAGSSYLIVVVNTDPASTSLEDFTLVGSSIGAAGAAAPRSVPTIVKSGASATRTVVGDIGSRDRTLQLPLRARDLHMVALEANRRIFATRGNPRRSIAPSSTAAPRPIATTIGSVNKVYVREANATSCAAVDSIGARTVAVGQHVIVLADTNLTTWPDSLRPDSAYYQTFANEYDAITWPHLLAYIGDPLAYDASLSGIGKVTVTITPLLNNISTPQGGGSVVAFVNGCDFFTYIPTGPDANLSNQTEMFYSWVPSAKGYDVPTWEKGLRATAAHESKHIVSYTDRILNNASDFEEVWLEEGLAQESSEIWERNFSQATWKGHATFVQTVACEINLGTNAPCDAAGDKPVDLAVGHLPYLFQYLQKESTANSEGLGIDTPANYGAGWAFARWSTDQYAPDEGTFIKSLINEQRTGLANLSAHTGQSQTVLLVYWNVASGIFQTPTYTAADVRTTYPSFDFANIFRIGQTGVTCGGVHCGIFTNSGTPTYPVQPVDLTPGAFSKTMLSIPGTSAAYFLLTSTAAGSENLALLSGIGSAIATTSGFRVAILRVQ